ncbi:MAG: sigma-70 family RNA polymerase sigma factor, partial [Planctomycetes bacterium]|nr:sigma-70 family RNA polymerase sigma factor [Planctomycetota bacterium]
MPDRPSLAAVDAELAKHADFLRAIARDLVSDASRAEDLVQETWLAALEGAPAGSPGLRGWLAVVARRLAWRMERGENRRRLRERRSARFDSAPDPLEDLAAREAAMHQITRGLSSLDTPYREVLILRYFEALEPREIAKRLGIPAATVRTRLHRGLEGLRRVMDDSSGGQRRSWALALLPWIVPVHQASVASAGTVAVPVLKGALIVNKSLGIVSAVLVFVALAILAVFRMDFDASERLSVSEDPAMQASDDVLPGRRAGEAVATASEPSPESSGEEHLLASPDRETASVGPWLAVTLKGRVLGPGDLAVSGVTVRVLGPAGPREDETRTRTVNTASDGAFTIRGLAPRVRYGLRFRGAEFRDEARDVSTGAPGEMDLGIIRVATGGSIEGLVMDEAGRALGGGEVLAVARGDAHGAAIGVLVLGDQVTDDARRATVGSDGRFRIAGLDDGVWGLQVRTNGFLPASQSGFRIENASGISEVRFRLLTG